MSLVLNIDGKVLKIRRSEIKCTHTIASKFIRKYGINPKYLPKLEGKLNEFLNNMKKKTNSLEPKFKKQSQYDY